MIVEPAQVPEIITPLFRITPEIEFAYEDEVYKLPPIPTPPVTTRAPVDVEVEDAGYKIDIPVPILVK